MKKGQALLLVFFIFIIVSILTGALAGMWIAEIKTRSLERDSLGAFYLAQAGIAYARNVLYYDAVYASTHHCCCDFWASWSGVTDKPLGGGSFSVTLYYPYGCCLRKRIVSTGTYGKATRKIQCDLDTDYYSLYVIYKCIFTVTAGSWREQ